jgi:fermentation-respiration switch protein FrsA (DUF1100 family)
LFARRWVETVAGEQFFNVSKLDFTRLLDDPMRRVADIYSAVDYLTTLNYVDATRIGVLGICAGSGTAVKAASLERRIKAVATVSAVDVGAASERIGRGDDQVAGAGEADGAIRTEALLPPPTSSPRWSRCSRTRVGRRERKRVRVNS